jgi:hypothetical protein
VILTVLAAAADAAGAATTKMVIASRATAAELDALSHRTNVMADVLTVDRREYLLHLDGSGGGALSGENLSPTGANQQATVPSTMRVPFEQIALIYFREIPAGAKNQSPAFNYPAKEAYPSVAGIGAAEKGMDCGELDLEIARTGTIRWYARQQGVAPFTAHEALVQHGKNTAKDVGIGILVAVVLIGAAGGGGAAIPFPAGGGGHGDHLISAEDLRWAVTAADRREVGLLQLKLPRSCPAVASPDRTTSDLDILSRIEATRAALGAHQISDLEQRDQQTQLLDQLDPSSSATVRVAPEFEFAAAAAATNGKKGESIGGAALATYGRYVMVEVKRPDCGYPRFGWPLAGHPTQLGGPFDVRERALTWTREDSDDVESLEFKDIEELRPTERHYGAWFFPVRMTGGSCLFIHVTDVGHGKAGGGQALQETARSTILARLAQSPK